MHAGPAQPSRRSRSRLPDRSGRKPIVWGALSLASGAACLGATTFSRLRSRGPWLSVDLTNHSSRTHCVGRLNSGVRPTPELNVSHPSFGVPLLLFLAISAPCVFAEPPPGSFPPNAVQVVLATRQDQLRELDDPESWWHDTKERTWSVKRPFDPGVLDTTHMFLVSYKIDGTIVATWQVDTREGTATELP